MKYILTLASISIVFGLTACSGDSEFTSRTKSEKAESTKGDNDSNAGGENGDGLDALGGEGGKPDLEYVGGDTPNPGGLAMLKDCDEAESKGYMKEAKETLVYDDNFRTYKDPAAMTPYCNDIDVTSGGRVSGWYYEPKKLEIPNSRVVCGMTFKSESEMQYDDALIMTVNDKMLFWGNTDVNRFDKDENGLPIYTFAKMKGASISNPQGCLDGSLDCDLPGHDTPGKLNVTFNDETNLMVMKEVEKNGAEFFLRTFGDDNPDVDCTHQKLDFIVNYKYFVK